MNLNNRYILAGVLAVIVLTLFSYRGVYSSGFIWDDDDLVTENYDLRSVDGLKRIWTEPASQLQYYPMTFTSFWIEYQLWRDAPAGYHLVNVFLHVINAFLVWLILVRLKVPGAFLAAIVFAVHPVHVETVAWISERKNLLSTVFYLLSMLSFVKYFGVGKGGALAHKKNTALYFLALLFYCFALFSKTVTLSLPVVLLLILWWKNRTVEPGQVLRIVPMLVIGIVLGWLTVSIERYQMGEIGRSWSLLMIERFLIAGNAVWFYIGKLIYPVNLSFVYTQWDISLERSYPGLLAAAAAVVVFALFRKKKNMPAVGTGLLFFLITIFPALGFFDVETMTYTFVADHYQYLASVGLIALFSGGCVTMIGKSPRWRVVLYIILGMYISWLSVLTVQQVKIYKNKIALYTDTIEKNPGCWMAYHNRAVEYSQKREFGLALDDLRQAIVLNPRYYQAFNTRGNVHSAIGQYADAMGNYNRSLVMDPSFAVAYVNRGSLFARSGNLTLALGDLNRAIEIRPKLAMAYVRRAEVYMRLKKFDEALADYDRALMIVPDADFIYRSRDLFYEVMRGQKEKDSVKSKMKEFIEY